MNELILELENERGGCRPGETIRGTARWQLAEPVEGLEVRLFWYTQGKGDRDVGIVATEVIPNAGLSGSREFAFKAPAGPHSFSGQLISLLWAVELVVVPDGDAARKELVISPTGREIRIGTPELDGGGGGLEPS